MGKYLLIESRDPFDSAAFRALASGLAKAGNEVTFFLVQNGVLQARICSASETLADLAVSGVEVLADDFSLRERGIGPDDLAPGVRASPLDVVIDQFVAGRKAIWH